MHPEDVKGLRTTFDRFPRDKTDEERKKIEDRPFVAQFLGEYLSRHPLFKLALAETTGEVLGHVEEGKEDAYVIYRSTVDDLGRIQDRIKVVQLRKDGEKWAIQVPESQAMFRGTMFLGFRTFAGNNPPLIAGRQANEKTNRFEAVGRLLTGGDTAYVVIRHVTPRATCCASSP